jgi:RNA polymerase sigma-70 factor (ECF subfamily)
MGKTDAELIQGARQGEAAALDELLARHQSQVYRFGLRMCGNEEDARDVLQETLVAALRGLPEFRGEADLSTWLYRIAQSFCTKSRRRHVGEPSHHESLEQSEVLSLPSPEAQPEAQAHAKEIAGLLQLALLSLPEPHREAVVLKDVEGLSAEEGARVLSLEVAAFKSRLHRGRMELRQRLTELMEPATPASPACPELAQELAAYAGQEVDQSTCAHIEQHLQRCPRCAQACQELQRSVSLCRQLPGGEVPAPVQEAVREALRRATRELSPIP